MTELSRNVLCGHRLFNKLHQIYGNGKLKCCINACSKINTPQQY